MISRRSFNKQLGTLAAVAALAPATMMAERKRKVQLGHTGITWPNANADQAIHDIGQLGFYGYETFGEVIARKDAEGNFAQLLAANHLPLISGYCTINLTDTTKRDDELTKARNWARLIKKYDGRIFVLGPNQVKRDTYDYAASKSTIIGMLNDVAKTVQDEGLMPVLHQHTGTCVETRDETYATLDAMDTKALKFGPDVGQLTKGGADALKVVKDYLPLVQHMHLKDYNGQDEHLLGYCTLGKGKLNVPGILDLMQGHSIHGMIMVELDNNPRNLSPVPPFDLAKESVSYLKSIGVRFRS
ncbi:MAG TPA: sugar phosphate isomerase/epimerase [Terracidiphilus sp.]|nr:sugar phosphate isomerase/epimerase [Terracidiphilus sp.]